MNIQKFSENEIPYESLSQMGFTQEMIDDLPEDVMRKFLSGEKTPLLSSSIKDANGKPMRASIWLSRKENGEVVAFYRPYEISLDFSDFNAEQQITLMRGDVVLTSKDGQEPTCYQLDNETNQILSCPVSCLRHNLDVLQKAIGFADEETFEKGMPQTYMQGHNPVSFGIDLSDSKGIRIVNGSIEDWQREKGEKQLPRYNFGIYGCWTLDKNENLTYVREEDYTDDMIKAQNELVESRKPRGMRI